MALLGTVITSNGSALNLNDIQRLHPMASSMQTAIEVDHA
jgi:hypothetical protein